MPPKDITAEALREQMDYDPETGSFYWKPRRAGCPGGGYWQIRIKGRCYYAHQLAWLYVHGEWPSEEIDHINRDRLDNRIANLRAADRCQNQQNKLQSNNKSGFKGVSLHNPRLAKPWQAQITVRGQHHHLGNFSTPEEAHEAYKEAAARLHGEFARTE